MIINPSMIFERLKGASITGDWVRASPPHESGRRSYEIICKTCQPKLRAMWTETPSSSYIVRLVATILPDPKEPASVVIYAGKCSHCGTNWWYCDHWDWVSWLSDFETLKTILKSAHVLHQSCDTLKRIEIVDENTWVFSPDGELKYDFSKRCKSNDY